MLLCHTHRFIFLKTWKTGSTSVELGLGGLCGCGDVITPVGHDEKDRIGPPPQNQDLPHSKWTLRNWAMLVALRSRRDAGVKFYNHMSAKEVARMVPADIWRDYLKISIERNPWDREVSHYYWRLRNPKTRPPFRDYVLDTKRKMINNFDIYSIDGKIVADVVLRNERLAADYAALSERLGCAMPPLPRVKAIYREDRRPYQELFDEETRAVIARRYAKEIEAFGYEF